MNTPICILEDRVGERTPMSTPRRVTVRLPGRVHPAHQRADRVAVELLELTDDLPFVEDQRPIGENRQLVQVL